MNPEEEICLKNCYAKLGNFSKFAKEIGFVIKWFRVNNLDYTFCILFLFYFFVILSSLIPIIKVNRVKYNFITPFDSPTLIPVSLCLWFFLLPSWSPLQSRSLCLLWLQTYLPLCTRFSSQRRWITRRALTMPRNRLLPFVWLIWSESWEFIVWRLRLAMGFLLFYPIFLVSEEQGREYRVCW